MSILDDFKLGVTCPLCGYEFDDEEVWHSSYSEKSEIPMNHGDQKKVQCHRCDKDFYVSADEILLFCSTEID